MASSANCGTVLIADENGPSREELVGLFEAAGYEVMSVSSGEEALRVADEVDLSIVLLEIPLGNLSGYECAGSLARRRPTPDRVRVRLTGGVIRPGGRASRGGR